MPRGLGAKIPARAGNWDGDAPYNGGLTFFDWGGRVNFYGDTDPTWNSSTPLHFSFNNGGHVTLNQNIGYKSVQSLIYESTFAYLNIYGNSTVQVNATQGYFGETFVQAGTLRIGGGVSIASSSGVTVSGGTLDIGGESPVVTLFSGTVKGAGTISGNFVQNGGTLSPANSPGTLNVTGDATWNGGSYLWEINDAAPGPFGTGGKVTTDIGASTADLGYSVAIQADGKIVVAGRANNGSNNDFALARYNIDGSLDTSFGRGGKVTTPIGASNDDGYSVAIQADGKIVVAGYAHNGSNNDFALARYYPDGSLDTGGIGGFDPGWDLLNVTGTLTVNAAYTVAVDSLTPANSQGDAANFNPAAGYSWKIAAAAGGVVWNGTPTLDLTGFSNPYTGTFALTYDANNVYVTYSPTTEAGNVVWDGGSTSGGLWSNYTNWVGEARPADGSGTTIHFAGSTRTVNTNDFAAGRDVGSIVFDSGADSFTLRGNGIDLFSSIENNDDSAQTVDIPITLGGDVTLSASAGDLTVGGLDMDGADDAGGADVIVNGFGQVTISGPIEAASLANAVTKDGGGSLTISGDNTGSRYRLNLLGGTVRLDHAAALGDTWDAEKINFAASASTLRIGATMTHPLMGVTFSHVSAFFDVDSGVTFSVGGALDNTGGDTTIIKTGPGTFSFTGWAPASDVSVAVNDGLFTGGGIAYGLETYGGRFSPGSGVGLMTAGSSIWGAGGYLWEINDAAGSAGFGSGGKVTTSVGAANDTGQDVAIQSDGKIVVAGSSHNGANDDFAIVRYNTDGSLDTTFDSDGKVTIAVGSYHDRAFAVAVQGDGKILAGGVSHNGSNMGVALVRCLANGSLDTSFDGDGKAVSPDGGLDDYGMDLAIQSDGKIVVAGYSQSFSDLDIAVVRHNSDGSTDTSFGTLGRVITPIGAGDDEARGVALQPDGKIVAVGYTHNGTDIDFAVVRYNDAGALDASFGVGGKVSTPIGTGIDWAYDVAIQSDGKAVVAGSVDNAGNSEFAVTRYDAAGALDASFGVGGKLTNALGAYGDVARGVATASGGHIVVVGSSSTGSKSDLALVRYRQDGSLDTGGDAGTDPGWDLLDVAGTLTVQSAHTVTVDSLTPANAQGDAANFNPAAAYTWKIATAAGGVTWNGTPPLDVTGFSNPYTGTFALSHDVNNVYITYTPPPPPSQPQGAIFYFR